MNILVTGAAGFVGKHLTKELNENGHSVIAALNNNEKSIDGINCIHADLSLKKEVNERIDFKNIDAVIHLAGLAVVGPSYDEPLNYICTNSGIEINLYESCISQNAKPKFLIVSTGTIYDPHQSTALIEDSPISPTTPYAVSKIAQEALALYYNNRGFEYVITRPFNHIGPGQNPGFIVPDLAKQVVAAERGEISEILVGNLDAKRDYTDVRDIVKAYRLLIENSDAKNQIFNVCSGNSVSGKEILSMILAKSLVKLTVTQDPDRMRPSDIQEIIGSHNKLTDITGWEPTYSIEQTIEDALEDWRNRK